MKLRIMIILILVWFRYRWKRRLNSCVFFMIDVRIYIIGLREINDLKRIIYIICKKECVIWNGRDGELKVYMEV